MFLCTIQIPAETQMIIIILMLSIHCGESRSKISFHLVKLYIGLGVAV